MAQDQRPDDPWARFGSAYDANFTEANHAVAIEGCLHIVCEQDRLLVGDAGNAPVRGHIDEHRLATRPQLGETVS